MGFLIEGELVPNAPGTATGQLFIEERDIKPLYAYLQNGEPIGPDKDHRGISLVQSQQVGQLTRRCEAVTG